MKRYIATFHTHLGALRSVRAMGREGISSRLMPVPRKLSASCGTCAAYEADSPCLHLLDADMEAVYLVTGVDAYTALERTEK